MSKLRSLSDADIKAMYDDSVTGLRKGNLTFDDDGYDEGGYTQNDFYTGQITDWSKGNGAQQRETEKSKLKS